MAEFMGKDGFVWWQGVVEDRYDPLYLGRCRVRILGWHTEDKTDMPTESLPWSYPVQPILSAAQTGVGYSPTGPVEGTWVVGFYRDGEQAQEPVFFGTLGGIPSLDSKIPPNEGFADPRGDTNPSVHPQLESLKADAPTNILTFNSERPERNIPYPPVEIKHYSTQAEANTAIYPTDNKKPNNKKNLSAGAAGGSISVVMEEQMNRSTYPRTEHLGESTTPREARGRFGTPAIEYSKGIHGQKMKNFGLTGGPAGFQTAKRKMIVAGPQAGAASPSRWFEPPPIDLYGAVYPYNHVQLSESGHLIEVDDTPNHERLHRYHRTGTYEEIGSLGQRIVKVVNENYHMGLNNDYTSIKGSKFLNITNTLDIVSKGGYFHDNGNSPVVIRGGSFKADLPGSKQILNVNPDGITIDAGGAPLILKGSRLEKVFTDASQTDTTKGGYTQKVGGIHSMEAGSISLATKGSTGITSGGALNILATGNITETIVNMPPAAAARETLAVSGDINFNAALGSVNLDCGRIPISPGGTGLFSSLALTPSGISMSSLVALTTLDLNASGIELKALSGLASVSISGTGIALKYGASSIELGPAGITLKGVLITSEASGINAVKGSLVQLN